MKTLVILAFALDLYGTADLTPVITANGEHRFTLIGKPDRSITKTEGGEEIWIDRTLSILLAANRWCLNGWEVTSKKDVAGQLLIEGQCLK